MSLLGFGRYRPPDTVWSHVIIWGSVTNRTLQAYRTAQRFCSKEKRIRRGFWPRFSLRIWNHEHQDKIFTLSGGRAKWGHGLSGFQMVRYRMHRNQINEKRRVFFKKRVFGYRYKKPMDLRRRWDR